MIGRRWLLLLLAIGLCPGSLADPPSSITEAPLVPTTRPAEIPPAPATFKGRRIATTMHYAGAPWLVRGSRDREEGTDLFLRTLEVAKGSTACDLGCGNGYYALPLARRVGPEGRVYAVDIQPEMLELLDARAEDAELENIEPVLGTLIDPNLPPRSIDLMILVDVYHEMSHPEQMLAAIHAAMKPDGRVVLLEFRAEDPDVPIKPLHKMSKTQILKEWLPSGFRLIEEFDGLPWQHMMTFGIEVEETDRSIEDGLDERTGREEDETSGGLLDETVSLTDYTTVITASTTFSAKLP